MLIAFIGIDGSGKSWHVRSLARWLLEKRYNAVQVVEDRLGAKVFEEYTSVLYGDGAILHPSIPLDIQVPVRATDLARFGLLVKSLLNQGKVVICDRYLYCMLAYASAEGADLSKVIGLFSLIPRADIAFLCDIPPRMAVDRILLREKPIRPQENLEIIKKARNAYLRLSTVFPEIKLINSALPRLSTQNSIRGLTLNLLRKQEGKRINFFDYESMIKAIRLLSS